MSPTRRDTLKAAGAASGLAMLGGHAVAQRDGPGSGDDNPGAQQLEEGQGGVRVGHFVSGAPAVNVRLVPADGGTGTDDDSAGDGGTDTETETGGNETGGNATEDLQLDDDSNETNDTAGNETDVPTDGGTTTDGEGELVAENVSFGDVSEYASVEAGDYTVRIVEYVEETTDTDAPNGTDNTTDGNTTDNTTDDNTSDADTDDDPIISLPDDLTSDGNDTEDDEAGGNTSDDNATEDLQLDDDSNETNDTAGNDTDDPTDGGTTTDGEVLYEEAITVGESYYTVVATGMPDDIQTLLLQDYDAAQVRLVHASPDAPAVDVVAPEASMTLFDGATYGQATEYVGVPPGSYSLSVREAAAMNDGDEVGTSDVELEAGEAYSVYAVGSPEGGEEAFQLVVNQDGQGADAGLGSDDAPGQQDDSPGRGNQSGGPGGDGQPGRDNDSDGPGRSGNAGGGGPNADESEEADDEPGGPGGAAGPNNPGDNETGDNASDDESGNESDDGGLFAY